MGFSILFWIVAKGDRIILRDCKSRRAAAALRDLQSRSTIISLAASCSRHHII